MPTAKGIFHANDAVCGRLVRGVVYRMIYSSKMNTRYQNSSHLFYGCVTGHLGNAGRQGGAATAAVAAVLAGSGDERLGVGVCVAAAASSRADGSGDVAFRRFARAYGDFAAAGGTRFCL